MYLILLMCLILDLVFLWIEGSEFKLLVGLQTVYKNHPLVHSHLVTITRRCGQLVHSYLVTHHKSMISLICLIVTNLVIHNYKFIKYGWLPSHNMKYHSVLPGSRNAKQCYSICLYRIISQA